MGGKLTELLQVNEILLFSLSLQRNKQYLHGVITSLSRLTNTLG